MENKHNKVFTFFRLEWSNHLHSCCVCELLSVKHEIHIKLALLLSSLSLYYFPQFSTEPELQ